MSVGCGDSVSVLYLLALGMVLQYCLCWLWGWCCSIVFVGFGDGLTVLCLLAVGMVS